VGYGVGTSVQASNRIRFNIEALGTHISENGTFTESLNAIAQGKVQLEWRWGKQFSVFGGVTYNYMFSKLYDDETQVYGSSIRTTNLLSEKTVGGTNQKAWLGFNAGIRF